MNRRPIKIVDMVKAHPPKTFNWGGRLPTVEETGKGNLLCYEAYGGRLFRSDEGAVREAVEKFIDDYSTACLRSAEDPASVYVEVFSFNDLYNLFGILPTHFGDLFGYSSTPDAVQDLKFRVELCSPKDNFIAEQFGEDVLVIEPFDAYAYPCEYYKEL